MEVQKLNGYTLGGKAEIGIEQLQAELEKVKKDFEKDSRSKNGTWNNGTSEQAFINREIYKNLPGILKKGCSILKDAIEKEVFLLGGIGIISGLLPNVSGFYDGKDYQANLYVYILGKFGSGKGSLSYCRKLGAPIHAEKLLNYEDALKEYLGELVEYKKKLTRFKKSKGRYQDPPEEPEAPKQEMLFIPANNSKTGAFELLSNNKGYGIIFETEGDSLADALRQDYGNYSDGLRKAFHHELISYYRRGGKEYVEIKQPKLSVVLSSTFDQFRKLIPSVQNGLFSRFMYYELGSNPEFKNVFDKAKSGNPAFFDNLGQEMYRMHKLLLERKEPIYFELTPNQEAQFLGLFQEWKKEFQEYISEDLDGTVHRLGLICFRIALILTTLRNFDNKLLIANKMICQDIDFSIALQLISSIKQNSIKLFYQFPEEKTGTNPFSEKAIFGYITPN